MLRALAGQMDKAATVPGDTASGSYSHLSGLLLCLDAYGLLGYDLFNIGFTVTPALQLQNAQLNLLNRYGTYS